MVSRRQILRLAIATGLISGAMALSVNCSGSDSAPNTAADEQAIRQVAEGLVQAVNDRDYEWIVSHLNAANCDIDISEEQQRQAWEQVGEELGDTGYSLAMRDFTVTNIKGDRAQTTATVVVHASGTEYPFGSSSDPFFDIFVKEDEAWKAVAC